MSSKPNKKIVGGLLAALLALFAAVVVVAAPATAAPSGGVNVTSAANLAQRLFGHDGSDAATSGISVDSSTNTITVGEDASGITLGGPQEIYLNTNYTLQLDNETAITQGSTEETNYTLTVTGPGSLIIEGTGEITSGNNVGYGPVITVGTTANSGKLVMNGGKISDTAGDVCILVVNGDAQINDGAAVDSSIAEDSGEAPFYGAIQVGAGSAPTLTATCEINNGASVTGRRGVTVVADGDLTVNGGEIEGTKENGIAAVIVDTEDGATAVGTPTVTVKGGSITGQTNGIAAGTEGKDQTIGAGSDTLVDAPNTSATIDVQGGTITATTGVGLLDNVESGSIEVSGGIIKAAAGQEAMTSQATKTSVSGGNFSAPVSPSYLSSSVGAMGVIPGKGNAPSTYGYYASENDVPSNATATVPVDGKETTVVCATGVVNGNITNAEYTPTAPTSLQSALAKLGVSDSDDAYKAAAPATVGADNIWVIWYGEATDEAGYGVTVNNGGTTKSATYTSAKNTTANGFHYAYLDLDGNPAGTWTFTIDGGAGQLVTEDVEVAGITLYNGQANQTAVQSEKAVSAYYAVNAEAKAITLPAITNNPLSSDALDGGSQPSIVGWYELTPTTSGNKTTYAAALYDGGAEWTPNAGGMTTLMAGYMTLPTDGITATLSVDPTNVLTNVGASATLTFTIGQDALGESVSLANLPSTSSPLNITNQKSLVASTADVAEGIVNTVAPNGALATSAFGFNTYDSSGKTWTSSFSSVTPSLTKPTAPATNPTVSGNTVNVGITLTTSGATAPDGTSTTNPIAVTVDFDSVLGVKGAVTGTQKAPEIEGPAATFNLFAGLTTSVKVMGNGTVTQTVDSKGNITLTAVPNEGGTFVGWQIGNLSQMLTGTTYTIMAGQNPGQITAYFEGGVPTPPEPVSGTVDVTRLYNPYLNGAHLLSASETEVANLKAAGWTVEGTAFTEYTNASANGGQVVPVYRLYNPYNGDHFYTASNAEAETMKAGGWQREGTAWYAPVNSNVGVTRLYNPYMTENAGLGNHLWSANYSEVSPLLGVGWKDEGRAWFAVSAPGA